jgi:RNA polymerase-binding transcription factor DksA
MTSDRSERRASNAESTPDDALARRAEELETLRQAEHDTAFSGDERDMSGELSGVDQHPADTADILLQREMQQTTQELLGREQAQVEEALRARERGTYGTCQECGRQIPAERLEARPEATLCVECQRRREGARSRNLSS